ncbi:hypothetical protein [Streptomyces minutiscleroticus]|uniref:hypothetical protein n=1 Tax=Streptomyces minutiscleroticus TaxID=68238 RepID=UPI00331F41D8
MTDEDREPAPASGMRADHDDHVTRDDAGWPRRTGAESGSPQEETAGAAEGTADVVEEEPSVRRAVDDDTGTDVLTGEDAEDRGPLAPEFEEPTGGEEPADGGP